MSESSEDEIEMNSISSPINSSCSNGAQSPDSVRSSEPPSDDSPLLSGSASPTSNNSHTGVRNASRMESGTSTRLEKTIVLGVAFIVLCLIILIAVIIVGVKLSNKDDNSKVCITLECVSAASDLQTAMNTSVDPCEDFYQFSCGKWINNNSIPETSSSWSQFDVLKDKLSIKMGEILRSEISTDEPPTVSDAKIFFAACVLQDVEDATPLLINLLDSHLSDIDDQIGRGNLGEKLGELRQNVNGNYLLNFDVELDEKNSSNYILYLDQPSFGLNRKFYVGAADNNPSVVAYRSLIEQVWPLIYNSTSDQAKQIAEQVVAFEKSIAEISTAPENRQNISELYNKMTLQQCSDLVDPTSTLINWEDYTTKVFENVIPLENLPNLEVIVRDKAYFSKLVAILQGDTAGLGNYLKWRAIHFFVNDVSKKLRDVVFEYTKTTQETQVPPNRTQTCADRANDYYGMAISYEYVQKVFGSDSLSQIGEMVNNLRKAFIEILKETEWIAEDVTRAKAVVKAEKMKAFVGYPDWLLNKTALANYYNGLNIGKGNHFTNYLNAIQWSVKKSLKNLVLSENTDRWLTDLTVVKAFYSGTYNSISFLPGILQPPFYYRGKTIQSLNYGAIGMVIGHEITHGFDDTERQRDGDGNLVNWMDEGTLENYKEKAKCFENQYQLYEPPGFLDADGLPVNLNGEKTLDENIADNGGLRESFKAYKAYVATNGAEKKLPGLDYTPEQLFFVSFSQIWCGAYQHAGLLDEIETGIHSPKMFRVRGVIDNSKEFAETWGCKLPEQSKQCQIW